MIDLEHWENDVVISLLLTRRCNFICAHCMYECGSGFRGYMSHEVLVAVRDQIRRLQSLGIHPRINLVGGEPTLNLHRFEEILETVMQWDIGVEMTTNGWWLHKDSTATEFFGIVARYVSSDGCGLEGRDGYSFSIRISDDEFHDAHRPEHLRNNMLRHRLSEVWEGFDILQETKVFCQTCWHEFDCMPDYDECPKCGGCVDYEYEDLLNWALPRPADGDPWIYTGRRTQYNTFDRVVPQGRASSWGRNDKGCESYNNVHGLSYLPNGTMMDVCCKGSWCEFGTVYDDPLLLLELARIFSEEMKPRCCDCREDAREWKRKRFRKVKAELQKEIERI